MEFEPGDLVRIGERGVSVFQVVGEADDGRVLIEPTLETAVNNFPVPYPAAALVRHTTPAHT